jgi:hypothetical protein
MQCNPVWFVFDAIRGGSESSSVVPVLGAVSSSLWCRL